MFTRRRQGGVTLLEMILFIVVISVALAGLVTVYKLASRDSADPVRDKQALMLAEAMLEEVQLAGFTFCDPTDANAATAVSSAGCATAVERFGQAAPEPVGTRPFDNVNDYVSAAKVFEQPFLTAGLLKDVNGNTLDVSGFTVSVAIAPATLTVPNLPGLPTTYGNNLLSADTDVLHIKVEVAYDGRTLMLDGYRLRYAPNFQ
jgi:MSHA pilin protein MshD